MANHQKDVKKVATKSPKAPGTTKLPKYAQREAAISVDPSPVKSKGKK